MGLWKTNLEPKQIMDLAESVKKMYLEEHKGDDEIAGALSIHPHAAYQLRKLLGLARRFGDLKKDVRKVSFNIDTGNFTIHTFGITELAEELGLKESKAYGWHVKDTGKMFFTIELVELNPKDYKIGKKKKKEFEEEG